ncbi:MAG: aconitate hydratase AcnA, partial [Planctomycetes bacterium]|nr:aconitate hydratase AcnA [Planctomycetota bacterium]
MKSKWLETRTEMFGHEEPHIGFVEDAEESFEFTDGDVAIAAITSCTNTSNPSVMLAAGLVAKKAHALGLTRKPWVKTSLAPGSTVVTEYLKRAGLLDDLEALGFWVVGYGCTTCIGNSGPLDTPIKDAINEHDLLACSVLSGNRNFEGRIGPEIKANYLASPPLVVAYAIAGTVDIDLSTEPLAKVDGIDVYLKDIWPTDEEVQETIKSSLGRDEFIEQYADVFTGGEEWQAVKAGTGLLFEWSDESTYIHEPPFFQGMTTEVPGIHPIEGARVLCKFGDSVTTDHISPAGNIAVDSPAGEFLQGRGVPVSMFNSFGSRRGNDLIMTRGTFGNVRVKNQLAPGTEGGFTTDFTTGEESSIYGASCNYKEKNIPLVVLAGKDYGMGSSRDWAAKGTMLLGVKAVIAESYERIHRSNLVGMGVLPLEFMDGQSAASLGLDGTESFLIPIDESLQPRQFVEVTALHENNTATSFETKCRIDTPVEIEYYRNGGILHTVLRKMATY